MKRMGMAMAVLGLTGGVLFAPGVGHACEGHAKAVPEPAEAKPGKVQPLQEVDELLSAKCQCSSKADCTCKKGACECARCKGGRRHVMDALRDQDTGLKLEDARRDASAGIFI
ncbi:hypothetical protein SAMN05444354_11047 [Stigmatella aurantiaca]|uniref:Metallothionein n=1 Tax=Stigmatella aurantiaca TaxID=41 RepID=A0A1H7UHD2_STIAU|nr:metallothionein [Stigmatella aurantiaca]SEL96186.1 hypothetical protein SAMN05444354_11047 [Stigmatella aurantiaca]